MRLSLTGSYSPILIFLLPVMLLLCFLFLVSTRGKIQVFFQVNIHTPLLFIFNVLTTCILRSLRRFQWRHLGILTVSSAIALLVTTRMSSAIAPRIFQQGDRLVITPILETS